MLRGVRGRPQPDLGNHVRASAQHVGPDGSWAKGASGPAPGPAALKGPLVAVPSGLLKPCLEGVDRVRFANTWSRGRSVVIDVIIFMNDGQEP